MDKTATPKSPYLAKPSVDLPFILLPPFFCLLLILLFPSLFPESDEMPVWAWVVLVMGVDVSHVYSTLYRTYLAPDSRKALGSLLWVLPLVGFAASVVLYTLSPLFFWRVLAYLAVYHFVKQQYGFLRLYSRYEKRGTLMARLESFLIYAACLYPVLHWHLSGPRQFHWFVAGDFRYFPFASVLPFTDALYALLWLVYLGMLAAAYRRANAFNLPKFLLLTGTALSWYLGIVVFNGDMAFTLFNVVCHGIPYMALIWVYGQKKYASPAVPKPLVARLFARKNVVLFAGILLAFAFAEEWLWDRMVWAEHASVFGAFRPLRALMTREVLAILVPLLSLPQITHYLLDGYIWKRKYLEVKL